MIKRFLLFTTPVMCTLLAGCAHDLHEKFSLAAVDSTVISDNGKIGDSYSLFAENDSEVYVLNIPNEIFRIDPSLKKAVCVFDSLAFNIDSVIALTYQVKNAGRINYSKHTEKELKNADKSLFQVYSVSDASGGFYIPISVTAEAGYTDPEVIKQQFAGSNMNLDSIIAVYGSSGIKSIDFLFFLLETDKQFRVRNIYPLYSPDGKINYSVLPLKGCFVFNNTLYTPLVSANVGGTLYDSVSIQNNEPSFYFCAEDLSKRKCTPLISEQLIDGSRHSILNHITDPVCYALHGDHLISSPGKELIDLSSDKLFEFQPSLKDNELIEGISFMDGYIVLLITNKIRIPYSEQLKRQFGATTELSEKRIAVFDIKSGEQLMNHQMNMKHTIQLKGDHVFCLAGGAAAAPILSRYKIVLKK